MLGCIKDTATLLLHTKTCAREQKLMLHAAHHLGLTRRPLPSATYVFFLLISFLRRSAHTCACAPSAVDAKVPEERGGLLALRQLRVQALRQRPEPRVRVLRHHQLDADGLLCTPRGGGRAHGSGATRPRPREPQRLRLGPGRC